MRDPAAELAGGGPLGIHVEGAEIARYTGVAGDVRVGDGATSGRPASAELEVFEKDGVQGAASIKLWSMPTNFCQECGHRMESRQIEGRAIPACPQCGFIAWRNPLVATMVIVETPGGIILGRRSIEPGYGLWCLPGGFVNEDEHPAAAAARECAEEIAAEVEITGLLGVYHITRGDGRGMVGLAYRARLGEDQSPSAGSEMLEVGLFSFDNLPELAFTSHRNAIRDWAGGDRP